MRRLNRLKEWRERRYLTIRELGEKAGLGYVTVWRTENGEGQPSLRTVRKLAEALGVHPDELQGETDQGQQRAAA